MKTKILMLPLVSLVLVACGSGSDGLPPPSPQTYSLEAAAVQRATTNTSFTVSAVAAGETVSITFASVPGADEMFEGVVSKKTLNSVVITVNGAFFGEDRWNAYFSLNPYFDRGAIYATGLYDVITWAGDYPTAGKIGDSGPLATVITYDDDTKTVVWGREVRTWSIQAANATTAYGCLDTVYQDAAGVPDGYSESICYELDAASNIVGLRATVTEGGVTTVFK